MIVTNLSKFALLLATACALLTGQWTRVATGDDWIGSSSRGRPGVTTSLPRWLTSEFDINESYGRRDSAGLFSSHPRSLWGLRETSWIGRQAPRVIRAQNVELPDPQEAFSSVSPTSDGFGMSSGERGLSTRLADVSAPHALSQPNIEEPGPDSPDFPDSAFTVHPGVVYIETSVTTSSSKGTRVRDYFTDTLIRVGLWENWELRISSPGIIQQVGPGIDTTGFGPMTFGFKTHVWGEDGWIPAFGIIAQVTTPTASAGFDNGAVEPTVFFNFDHMLPYEFAFEWNAGMSWLKGDDGDRFVQGLILWAIAHELAPHVEGFVHGIVGFPAATGDNSEVVIGPGIAWVVSDRVQLDTSYNFGLTKQSPHRLIRFGLSMAF